MNQNRNHTQEKIEVKVEVEVVMIHRRKERKKQNDIVVEVKAERKIFLERMMTLRKSVMIILK